MKIGLFTDSFLPSRDGVATSVYFSAKELQKLGHQVYIVAPNQPHAKKSKHLFRILSIRVFEKPEIWVGLDIPQPSFLKISEIDFDIIHGHSGGPVSLLGWQIAQIRQIPFIETYHTLWRHYSHYLPFPRMFSALALKRISGLFGNDCDGIIAPSKKAKNELLSYGVKKPIFVLPSGIDLKQFQGQTKGFLHQKFFLPHLAKIVLSVGRLSREKSLEFLIESFAKVAKEEPEAVLVLIGQGQDESQLKQLVEQLKISTKVIFAGGLDYQDMPKVFADADVYIFSSTTETQGLSILEALASGVPVVAVEDSAFEGVLENSVNGFLTNKNSTQFAQKVLKLLKNKDLREKFSQEAINSAQRFSSENFAKSLEQIYLDILVSKEEFKPNFLQKFIQKHFKSVGRLY